MFKQTESGKMLDIDKIKLNCGDRIKSRYRELNRIAKPGAVSLTQERIAEYLDVSEIAVKNWCRGSSMPEIPKLIELSILLDCDPGYLLCTQDQPRQEYTNVAKVTGLSEKSVERLKRWNTPAFGFIAITINELLAYRDTVQQTDDPLYAIHSFLRQSNRAIYVSPTTGRVAEEHVANMQEYQSDDIQTLRIGHLLRDVKRSLMGKQE